MSRADLAFYIVCCAVAGVALAASALSVLCFRVARGSEESE